MEQARTPAGATLRCTNCRQTWLVPGLRPGETHICKGCGHPLLIGERTERPPRETERRDVGARVSSPTGARWES
ncbi:MAG TPA: hypothetical protein VGV59_17735 [Pyrinomonadaceae bacterium]|nr:hypothetical protein [Pyrinomonadaceae bacterium]